MKFLFASKSKKQKTFYAFLDQDKFGRGGGGDSDPEKPLNDEEKRQFWKVVDYLHNSGGKVDLKLFCSGKFNPIAKRVTGILNLGFASTSLRIFAGLPEILVENGDESTFQKLGFDSKDLFVSLGGLDKIFGKFSSKQYKKLVLASLALDKALSDKEREWRDKIAKMNLSQRARIFQEFPQFGTPGLTERALPDMEELIVISESEDLLNKWGSLLKSVFKSARMQNVHTCVIKNYLEEIQKHPDLMEYQKISLIVKNKLALIDRIYSEK